MLTQNYKIMNPLSEETKTAKRQNKERAERTDRGTVHLFNLENQLRI